MGASASTSSGFGSGNSRGYDWHGNYRSSSGDYFGDSGDFRGFVGSQFGSFRPDRGFVFGGFGSGPNVFEKESDTFSPGAYGIRSPFSPNLFGRDFEDISTVASRTTTAFSHISRPAFGEEESFGPSRGFTPGASRPSGSSLDVTSTDVTQALKPSESLWSRIQSAATSFFSEVDIDYGVSDVQTNKAGNFVGNVFVTAEREKFSSCIHIPLEVNPHFRFRRGPLNLGGRIHRDFGCQTNFKTSFGGMDRAAVLYHSHALGPAGRHAAAVQLGAHSGRRVDGTSVGVFFTTDFLPREWLTTDALNGIITSVDVTRSLTHVSEVEVLCISQSFDALDLDVSMRGVKNWSPQAFSTVRGTYHYGKGDTTVSISSPNGESWEGTKTRTMSAVEISVEHSQLLNRHLKAVAELASNTVTGTRFTVKVQPT
jgi:hypothetical protein